MKLVYNNIIPFKGYKAMSVFPFIFVRKDTRSLSKVDINHESIHGRQQVEIYVVSLLLLILLSAVGLVSWWWTLTFPLVYYVFYALEYCFRLILYGFDGGLAYRNISFEQEAYLNESNMEYPSTRNLFASWSYLFKKSFVRRDDGRIIVKKG